MGLGCEPAATGFRDGVELGFAIVAGDAPSGGDEAGLFQPNESGIDGALIEQNFVAADLFDTAGDAVAVERTHGGEGFEDHEIEGSLEEVELG